MGKERITRISSRQYIDIELHKASDFVNDDLIQALTRIVEHSFELGGEANSASLARFLAANTDGLKVAISCRKRECGITRKENHTGDCTLVIKGDWSKYNNVCNSKNKKPPAKGSAGPKTPVPPEIRKRVYKNFFCEKCNSVVSDGWLLKNGKKLCDLCEAKPREYKESSDNTNSRFILQGGGVERNRRKF